MNNKRHISGKDARCLAPSPQHLATQPSTITFATPAALAKSSSVTKKLRMEN